MALIDPNGGGCLQSDTIQTANRGTTFSYSASSLTVDDLNGWTTTSLTGNTVSFPADLKIECATDTKYQPPGPPSSSASSVVISWISVALVVIALVI
jgi:hypothetical protein